MKKIEAQSGYDVKQIYTAKWKVSSHFDFFFLLGHRKMQSGASRERSMREEVKYLLTKKRERSVSFGIGGYVESRATREGRKKRGGLLHFTCQNETIKMFNTNDY